MFARLSGLILCLGLPILKQAQATVPAFHPSCARFLGPPDPESTQEGSVQEVSRKLKTFTEKFNQEDRNQLSLNQRLKRALIHRLTNNSPDSALYLLSPETHADSLAILSAVQKGQDIDEKLRKEFDTSLSNVREKMARLSGPAPTSIQNRLKALPLEYKRTLLRLRTLKDFVATLGPQTNANAQSSHKLKMPIITANGEINFEEITYTRQQIENNIHSYTNRLKAHEKTRDELLYEQAKLAQELSKLQDLVRDNSPATETVHENDKVVAEAQTLARDIQQLLAQDIRIPLGEDTATSFVLGRASTDAAHRLRSERTETAFRALLNERTRLVRIHKEYEARFDEMKKSYERVVAINPKMAEKLKLKVKLEAAKIANSMGASLARGAITGSSAIGTIGTLVLSIAGNPFQEKESEENKEEKSYLSKLNAEEEKCKSLYSDKNAFQKCILGYLKLLSKHPDLEVSTQTESDPSLKISSLSKYEEERKKFLDRILKYAEEEQLRDLENNDVLKKSYGDFEKSLERFKEGAKVLIEATATETPKG